MSVVRPKTLVILAFLVSVAACDTVTEGSGDPPDASVAVVENSFLPSSVTIPVGGTVRWAWSGMGTVQHNVIFDGTPGAPADCELQSVGVCIRTFPTAGEFDYVCTLHIGMIGTVTVTP